MSDLRAPLPPDVMPAMTWWPLVYRKYPVFSLPWLWRRTVLVAVLVGGYGALAALAYLMMNAPVAHVLAMVAYFTGGGVVAVTGGPALATWVRHRRFSPAVEVCGILATVLLGFVIAMAADWWASLGIAHH